MFGFVLSNTEELTPQQKTRYQQVYCGICRNIRQQSSGLARLGLSFDMAFLALLLMSLYEPEESSGTQACGFHPIKPRPWVDNPFIAYAADMNVALAYYNALDDYRDAHKQSAKLIANTLKSATEAIALRYPRQCSAIEDCIARLSALEAAQCPEPDLPAGCFGALMSELFVTEEDLWSPTLRQMGDALGRFIYLADAAVDYRSDLRKNQYNPYIAMGTGEDWARWEQYLVLSMGRCADYYERLPLVQDKEILDNILYSGVWLAYRKRQKSQTKGAGGDHNE